MYRNTSNAYKTYETNHVTTASPKGLLLMLYDGAVRFCRLAEVAMEEKDIEKKNVYLQKAQAIVSELTASLDDEAGEVAVQLRELYAYMLRELVAANLRMDAGKVRDVRSLLEDLRTAFGAIA